MKKVFSGFVAFCLAITLMFSCGMYTLAIEYVESIVTEDFSSSIECDFLPPGDADKNGKLDATDLSQLRIRLLNGAEYSINFDANGDNKISIIDLVREKKNLTQIEDFISDGSMILNGKSVCCSKNLSKFDTGASYKISYSYKSDTPVKIQIFGLTDEILYTSEASSDITTAEYIFKTPLKISDTSKIQLSITGIGVVEDFNIIRIDMDNTLIENW